ncbi:bifunctional molybdenum cofactor biosynthesis protein (molybdopterin-guanine dinucleotide biosynthesis protein A and MoaD) [Gluconobacter thailandicus F149-1 = NBRC 100600]|uniref:Molybdenum cofactor guanylyltransferase n=1 Tax=Gluconobacter thailandicus NBRC 3257 TaxID=1381097 RepID=A0ABQ0ITM4_GLUTH|nr:MoaD family protein [Gluconobacter thailandicus]KXV54064.1 molybdenum cofactor biosynthesis protein MoaAD [Gluconobacter thailandicus]GAC88818.1 bifunctional molybdenum cofactor biosynthesis protein MoaAD [Gluconobacter thailandicus NBRC 3255]GAD25569.1 bifunctional molybdenum cofactor biosynthesis protein MoaAD [Gluconobacter thailandicus NBRC 3257]GAN94387.1 bifunctional molybdenum cofactor biosynthesis protein (molybdopterin-guanine dinucleotide biosynthesis protein A and MoaD) [Gluconoba
MSPLYGLVLAGGLSSRMGQDKAALTYHGEPQLRNAFDALSPMVERCFISVRNGQKDDPLRAGFPLIVDAVDVDGPAAGLLSAHQAYPDVAWLVLACDLPLLDRITLETLIGARDDQHVAVAYRSEHDGLPEPLCAIWEPAALEALARQVENGRKCPRKLLINSDTLLLSPRTTGALDNINTPEERESVSRRLGGQMIRLNVEYFAQMRELAGQKIETVETAFGTVGPLYEQLKEKYGFPFEASRLRVALNGDFAPWTQPLKNGDHVVFIPPVTGG